MSDFRYEPNWESLKHYTVPDWYIDGKFGIFIHWGPYCVPAFGNEWYPRQMYQQDSAEFKHHVETWGPQTEFGYKDFIPMLTCENYDPQAWAELFRAAGAKFVVPVVEHHDGFVMGDSTFSRWCATKMGPKRDLAGDLAAETRKLGMVFGLSTHRAEHWWFMDGGRQFPSDVQDPEFEDFYGPAMPKDTPPSDEYLEDWLARTCELVDMYRPQLVWFDWWIQEKPFKPYLQRFAAYYYNRGLEWGQGVAINYKDDAYEEGTAVFDVERGSLADIRPFFWQTDTAVAKNSWGYTEGNEYKTVDSIVDDLVDIVSKNGALLLNIGPKKDGSIPRIEQDMLREIGQWLAVNGEAIYDTRPWKIYGEGPTEIVEGTFNDTKREAFGAADVRFTTKGDALYATALAWPEDGKMTVKSLGTAAGLAGKVASVSLVGGGALQFEQAAEALTVTLPEKRHCEHAVSLKVTFG